MKKTTILFTILFSCNLIFAQIRWNYLFPDENIGIVQSVLFEEQNKIKTFGLTITYDSIVPYVSLSNSIFDIQGELQSNNLLNSTDSCYIIGSSSDYSEEIISICGDVRYPNNPSRPISQFCLFYNKINQSTKTFVFNYNENEIILLRNAAVLKNGKYAFLIQDQLINELQTIKLRLIIADSLFNIQHVKYFHIPGKTLKGNAIRQFGDNIYLLLNSRLVTQENNPSDCIIYKMDTLFNVLDSFKTNDGKHYVNRCLLFLPNGDFVISGVYVDAFVPPDDFWQRKYLRCFDQDLNIKWTKYFGIRALDNNIFKIKLDSDGNIYGCGVDGVESITMDGDTIEQMAGCIFKFTTDGDSIWMRKYQGIDGYPIGDLNYLFDVTELNDGGYAACGRAIGFNPYMERGWVLRVDENGCLNEACTNSVKEAENFTDFMLYPNPAYEVLNVTNTHEIATYQIFEHSGKLLTQGNTFPIPISPLANGLYFLQLTTKQNQIINHKFLKQ